MPRTVCCVRILPGPNARFCLFGGPRTCVVTAHKRMAFLVCGVTLHASTVVSWIRRSLLGSPIARVYTCGDRKLLSVSCLLVWKYCSWQLRERQLLCCCSFVCGNRLTHSARGVIQNYRVPGASSAASGLLLLRVNWSAWFITNEQKLINSVVQSPSWNAVSSPAAIYWAWRFMSVFRRVRPFSVSWASLIQCTTSHSTSLRPISVLSSKLCVFPPSGLCFQVSALEACMHVYSPLCVPHATPIASLWILIKYSRSSNRVRSFNGECPTFRASLLSWWRGQKWSSKCRLIRHWTTWRGW